MRPNAMLVPDSEFRALEAWLAGGEGATVDRNFNLLPDTEADMVDNGYAKVVGNKADKLALTIKGRIFLTDLLRYEHDVS